MGQNTFTDPVELLLGVLQNSVRFRRVSMQFWHFYRPEYSRWRLSQTCRGALSKRTWTKAKTCRLKLEASLLHSWDIQVFDNFRCIFHAFTITDTCLGASTSVSRYAVKMKHVSGCGELSKCNRNICFWFLDDLSISIGFDTVSTGPWSDRVLVWPHRGRSCNLAMSRRSSTWTLNACYEIYDYHRPPPEEWNRRLSPKRDVVLEMASSTSTSWAARSAPRRVATPTIIWQNW